jgi:glucosyl-dolichyl phosphate glucuronosyltransferase
MIGRPLDVSIVICTRNRARQLSDVLTSARELIVPRGLAWEFIVVDNGSSDSTGDVIARFAADLPMRAVREEQPGLSNARNRGVAEARGRYICWTDDDVIIDRNWLSAYVAAFARHPEAAVFGGRVLPVLQPPTPQWFEENRSEWPLTTLLAMRDFGEADIPVTFEGGRTPYGANFAVRTVEQRRHLYDPELGVSPAHKRVGEETDVIFRILREGGSGWWVPDSKVSHLIPAKRQTMRYVYDYFFLAGETFAFLHHRHPGDNYYCAGTGPAPTTVGMLRLYRMIGGNGLRVLAHGLRGNRLAQLRHLRHLGFVAGIASYRRASGLASGPFAP